MSSIPFYSGSVPLSDPVREELLDAFQRAAREENLAPAIADRYLDWAFAYLSWCFGPLPRPVDPDQVEDFRDALERVGTGDEQLSEAVDALEFFFDTVGAEDILSSDAPADGTGQETGDFEAPPASETSFDRTDPSTDSDPLVDGGETRDSESSADRVTLDLDLPIERARRLTALALHVGLSPSKIALRAIDMVCDEIDPLDDRPLSTDTLIQQYQARLDLLHALEEDVWEEGE